MHNEVQSLCDEAMLRAPTRFVSEIVLGGTMVLPYGTYFSRYQYRRGHGSTVVPQYHKYRGTTVRYLPTNSHFSEDFRAKKTVY